MKPKLNKRAKTLSNRGENSEPIHTDLITEILSRLPIKSVTRCRCVWKLWSSIVTLPHFTELFLTRSSSHPHLLFAYKEKNEFIFLSSPQPQNPDNNNKSSPVTVKLLSRIPFSGSSCFITGQVQGLFCLTVKHKGMLPVQIICNPSTGQALTLPEIKKIRFRRCYFGYDQINNQFKVLSINTQDPRHHVLTLGTKRLRWRRIKDCIRHDSCLGGVCIDGVLYYQACTEIGHVIGCFNFRSEEFSFIKLETNLIKPVFLGALINYNGKLGSLISEDSHHVYGGSGSFELIVIGDFEKQEWSRFKYVLPPTWKDLVGKFVLSFVGVIGSNEIVLSHPSQVIYYNIEKGSIVEVGIQGMEDFRRSDFSTFVGHVEDLKLLQAF